MCIAVIYKTHTHSVQKNAIDKTEHKNEAFLFPFGRIQDIYTNKKKETRLISNMFLWMTFQANAPNLVNIVSE